VNQAEAEALIIQFIRDRPTITDFHVSGALDYYVYEHLKQRLRSESADALKEEIAQVFLDAAWDLALLGVLRPGGSSWPVWDKFDGTRYAVSEFGHRWASEGTEDAFVPVGSETYVELLRPYTEFGAPFFERAREAARCWKVKAFLACCSMCGAAAESILVAAAIAKKGDSPSVLSTYNSKGGRRKLELLLSGQVRADVKEVLAPLFGLVKLWRDEASHGGPSGIGQAAARTSLQALFLYARHVHHNWSEITRP
jgi:hypothetical protein